MPITHISVRGARQHNLRDINVRIPRNTLTVVTGLSGSGKSSLAFDTIYAEGQRRYVETLSAYARQFLDQIERPDVDSIEGLSPAISIEQKTTSRSPRSTVGTITEIYDYLRLLYASIGTPHCPNCGRPISRQTADQIVQRILELGAGERVTVMAPVVRGRKGEFKELLDQLDRQGFRARVDGEMMDLSEPVPLDRRKNHTIEAVIDRILLKNPPADAPPPPAGKPSIEKRLEAAVAKALQLANGLVLVVVTGSSGPQEQLFSSSMACPDCGLDVPKLEPRSFSFNSTFGACPECHGLGSLYDLDPAKVITDCRSRCSMVSDLVRPRSICCGSSTSPRFATRLTSRRRLKNYPHGSSTCWSTALPRARPRALDSTGYCLSCATRSKRLTAIPIANP